MALVNRFEQGEPVRTSRPKKVFLSFAGNDRFMAKRLADNLVTYGVEAFYDARDIAIGGNVVLSINRAIAESQYYVLLWSEHCVDRPWVDEEWAAAYARDLNEERSFLFVVCLDQTPLPPLLAVRRYLDGIRDWPSVARDLAEAWREDLNNGTTVSPCYSPIAQRRHYWRPRDTRHGGGPLQLSHNAWKRYHH